MGIFSNHYSIKQDNIEHLLLAKQEGDNIVFKYFQNGDLVETRVISEMGEFRLGGNGSEILVNQNWLGTKAFLVYPSGNIKLNKVSSKNVKINQTKSNEEENKEYILNFNIIGVGVILLIISLGISFYFPRSSNMAMKILPILTAGIGGYLISTELIQNENGFGKSKSRLLLTLLFGIGSLVLGEYLLGSNADVNADSPISKAVITKVDFHEAMRIKRKDVDAHWTHDYKFIVNGEEFNGYVSSPFEKYEIGDTIEIRYIADRPQFNNIKDEE